MARARSRSVSTTAISALPPFQRFLDAHRDLVWRFLVRAVGHTEAEDCFQETFIAALRAYPRVRADSNLRAWVLTIAHRKALDSHRARPQGAAGGGHGSGGRAPVGSRGHARRGAVAGGPGAALASALGDHAALPGRPAPPRHRGGDRLLGGGGAPLAARGPEEVERGDAGMSDRK